MSKGARADEELAPGKVQVLWRDLGRRDRVHGQPPAYLDIEIH